MMNNEKDIELHDKIINEAVSHLNSTSFDIYKNVSNDSRASIKGFKPDIILTEKGTNRVKFIMQVVLSSEVSQTVSDSYWKSLSDNISATLYLVIPSDTLSRAKEYCQKSGVKCRFTGYTINKDGGVLFEFE